MKINLNLGQLQGFKYAGVTDKRQDVYKSYDLRTDVNTFVME